MKDHHRMRAWDESRGCFWHREYNGWFQDGEDEGLPDICALDQNWKEEQCSGMKDLTGKLAYERDKIRFPRYMMGHLIEHVEREVVFHKGSFGVFYENEYDFIPLSRFIHAEKETYISNYGSVPVDEEPTFEIIGNIHEN